MKTYREELAKSKFHYKLPPPPYFEPSKAYKLIIRNLEIHFYEWFSLLHINPTLNLPGTSKFRSVSMFLILLLSLAPQPSLGLGLLHKIRLNFLEASQQFSFYRVGLLALRPTPMPDDQASVFISPRGRVATHFSRLLRHAWVTVGLFLFPGHHTGKM
jgi:hypothetical protein